MGIERATGRDGLGGLRQCGLLFSWVAPAEQTTAKIMAFGNVWNAMQLSLILALKTDGVLDKCLMRKKFKK